MSAHNCNHSNDISLTSAVCLAPEERHRTDSEFPADIYNANADEKSRSTEHKLRRRITSAELSVAANQLATLLRAGMPLVPALSAMVEQYDQQPVGQICRHLADQVNAGASLADAMQHYPDTFGRVFIAMVRAGEATGTLEHILTRHADALQKRARLLRNVKAALAYPAMMAVAAIVVVAFLMAFVVPGIAGIFDQMGHDLPLPTVLLITISSFMQTHLVAVLAAVCVSILAVHAYIRTGTGAVTWDRLKLRLPLLGKLILKIETIRITRTLGITLKSGISILNALHLVRQTVRNSHVRAHFDTITRDIQTGHSIAEAFRRTKLFDPLLYHTIATGQLSGTLEDQLIAVADTAQDEVEAFARSATTLIEPAILMIMGAIVGFIVLAILLPIFQINQML